MRSFKPFRIPGTYFFLALVLSAYLGQLVIAGSTASNAAFSSIRELPTIVYVTFNPWLHSYHLHVLENAITFAILGWWAERKVGMKRFVFAVPAAGYLTNLAPYFIGFGGLGVGLSGVTNMLWALFAGFQVWGYWEVMASESPDYRKAGIHLGLFFLGLLFILKSTAEFIGYISPPEGAATGAHMLGILLGLGWFVLLRAQSSNHA